MLKQGLKLIVGMAMVSGMVTGTTGCRSEDVATVGATIAIVAGAVAIGAADHGRSCHGDYREVCRSTYDRFGGYHRSCRMEWDSCARYYTASVGALAVDQTPAARVAEKFAIPMASAELLTGILQEASKGKSDALKTMGLGDDELAKVAKYELPSEAALDQVGLALEMDRTMAKGLVQSLINETKAQMADVNSPAWQACMATGKWKTDANGGTCKATWWSGCAPTSGASICVSAN